MSGELAYIDSATGLVACQVMDACFQGFTVMLDVKVTGRDDLAYPRGTTLTLPAHRVVPRKSIKRKKYGTYIKPYDWSEILGI